MPAPTTPPLPLIARPLTTPAAGLTEAEAGTRRAAGGGNDFRPATSRTYWEILRQNAYPGINGILIAVSILLVAWRLYIEALLTAGPVLGNIAIGVVQETRAKRKLDQIALLTRPKAMVVRDGTERAVDPADLVLGDLIVARRGDQVVLDGIIVGDGRVELDESLLSGEADPVAKEAGDRVLSGSAVVSGTVVYEATTVGAASFANRLLAEARAGRRDDRTPLQREIATTIWAVAGLVALTAIPVALALRALPGGFDTAETLAAAAVLVTLVPQGLAIMVTVTYAAGALRISHLGALVQRQNAIESMSRVTTLCVDKTGTLTTQRIAFAGAEPVGPAGGPDHMGLEALLGTIAASSGAPNRTTAALAAANPGTAVALADEVPFASERRWSGLRFADAPGAAALARAGVAPGAVYVLGAPADLLGAARIAGGALEALAARVAEIANRGVRVLLLARAPDGAPLRDGDERPVLPAPLVPVALLSFAEELRADVRETLAGFRTAGVDLKVISGDDPTTVGAIGRQVGLPVDGEAVSGADLDGLAEDELGLAADAASVFGRVDPSLKARLVDALRRRGRYVAMVGDGVNDILSLRRANLGIAMESGSAATRGIADLVLVGDRFGVLPRAVVEGQRIVAAMEATLILLLARTFYVLLVIAGAAIVGLPLPFTPRQNSVLAFATVGIPLIVLAIWIPPRRPPRSLIGETLRISIPASFAVAAFALPAFAWVLANSAPLPEARTILTTITIFCGLGLLPFVRSGSREEGRARAMGWWPWLLAAGMVVVYIAILEIPIVRDFYELTPLRPGVIATLVAYGLAWTIAVHAIRATGLAGRAVDALWARAVRLAERLREARRARPGQPTG